MGCLHSGVHCLESYEVSVSQNALQGCMVYMKVWGGVSAMDGNAC